MVLVETFFLQPISPFFVVNFSFFILHSFQPRFAQSGKNAL